jgi:hypothetical protein
LLLNQYDEVTTEWTALQHPLIDGVRSSVNAYPNSLAFDAYGTLHMTWVNRSTPAFQSNHNLYYARSPDGGRNWTRMDGTAYELPITAATAEVAVPIPEQSTLINQASMAVDQAGQPMVATWWAPRATEGNHTRQYMLVWQDGREWKSSQITDRPDEPKQTDSTVRELSRPLVLVDDDNRVIVVMRYKERGDVVTIAFSENRRNWQLVDLTSERLGLWEPVGDAELWKREKKLHLLYQPVGLGQNETPISVLEWDPSAFFAPAR